MTNNAARYPHCSEEIASHRLQVDGDPVAGLWRVQISCISVDQWYQTFDVRDVW